MMIMLVIVKFSGGNSVSTLLVLKGNIYTVISLIISEKGLSLLKVWDMINDFIS